MNKLLLLTVFLLFSSLALRAQKFAYVDVTVILQAIPEYNTAQGELDRVAEQWKQEISREYTKIDEMYRKYQAEEVLLSDNDRKRRQEDITNKEKEVREMQKNKFGPEGELFKKRQSLVRPIQERVYGVIEKYAAEKSYDFVFDKSSMTGMLFAKPDFDKTQDIIQRLGK